MDWLKVETDRKDEQLLVIAGALFVGLTPFALIYFAIKDLVT